MRALQIIAAILAFAGAAYLFRIVSHEWFGHGRIDHLHLTVALVATLLGVLLLYRGVARRR